MGIHEECGVFGVLSAKKENVAELAKVTVADVQKLAQEMFQKDKLEITVLGTVTEITMQ